MDKQLFDKSNPFVVKAVEHGDDLLDSVKTEANLSKFMHANPYLKNKVKYIIQCKNAQNKGLKSMNILNNTNQLQQLTQQCSSEENSVSEGDSSDEDVMVIQPKSNLQQLIEEDEFFDGEFEETNNTSMAKGDQQFDGLQSMPTCFFP